MLLSLVQAFRRRHPHMQVPFGPSSTVLHQTMWMLMQATWQGGGGQ